MKKYSLAAGLAATLAAPCTCSAVGFEVAGYFGKAIPKYSQTFNYDPGLISTRIPGVRLTESGTFGIEASGGLAASGAATLYVFNWLGIEGRYDTAEIKAKVTDAHFDATADLPFPFAQLNGRLDLTDGTAQIDKAKPYSLNVKLRTPGPVRLTFSGGVSFLNDITATSRQTLALGVTGVTPVTIEVAKVGVNFSAQTVALESGSGGKVGGNAGAGLQIPIGSHLAVVGEARGFLFKKRKLVWSAVPDQLPTDTLGVAFQNIVRSLQPVEFNPTFWQATGGLAISF